MAKSSLFSAKTKIMETNRDHRGDCGNDPEPDPDRMRGTLPTPSSTCSSPCCCNCPHPHPHPHPRRPSSVTSSGRSGSTFSDCSGPVDYSRSSITSTPSVSTSTCSPSTMTSRESAESSANANVNLSSTIKWTSTDLGLSFMFSDSNPLRVQHFLRTVRTVLESERKLFEVESPLERRRRRRNSQAKKIRIAERAKKMQMREQFLDLEAQNRILNERVAELETELTTWRERVACHHPSHFTFVPSGTSTRTSTGIGADPDPDVATITIVTTSH